MRKLDHFKKPGWLRPQPVGVFQKRHRRFQNCHLQRFLRGMSRLRRRVARRWAFPLEPRPELRH